MCISNGGSKEPIPFFPVMGDEHDFCPHCGSRNIYLRFEPGPGAIKGIYQVECGDCAAMGPTAESRNESLARWKQRFFKIETVGGRNG